MDDIIRDAEQARAEIFPVPGKNSNWDLRNFCHTAVINETYMVVGSHVEETLYGKIQRGEYVDFGRLILKDRVLNEDDQRLEMIIWGGRTY